MTHSRRLVLQVCIAAALGTGLMNATAQVQGYATEHVSVLRGEKNYTLQGSRLVPNSIALADESDERASDW